MQKEYSECTKQSKATVQSTGHSTANAVTDATINKVDEVKVATLTITEIAIIMQSQQNKQMKQMMEMFKSITQANPKQNITNPANKPTRLLSTRAGSCALIANTPTPNPTNVGNSRPRKPIVPSTGSLLQCAIRRRALDGRGGHAKLPVAAGDSGTQ